MSIRVLAIPSAGLRVGVESPREVFEQLADLIDTGYTFDEIEWEPEPECDCAPSAYVEK